MGEIQDQIQRPRITIRDDSPRAEAGPSFLTVFCYASTPLPGWPGFESPPPVRLGEESLRILPSRVRGPQAALFGRFNHAGQNVLQQGIGEGKLRVYQSEEDDCTCFAVFARVAAKRASS